jgi:hypothetical protein
LIFIKLSGIIPPEAAKLPEAGLFDNKRRKIPERKNIRGQTPYSRW